jgi:alginate O-acetyltransferase complex protein AlgJ
LLPRAADLKAAEKTLETNSVVSQWLLPRVQAILTGALKVGNEQVYLGRGAWLFYRPDVDYITGPPFLEAKQMRRRANAGAVQPDPVKAIVDFRNQLALRGIDLVAVPVPVKTGLDGDRLSSRVRQGQMLENASFPEFQARLTKEGIPVFDANALLSQHPRPLYLESDTHWRPETMEFVADQLAAFIHPPTSAPRVPLQLAQKEIDGVGDIARMLKLPPWQNIYRPERVAIHEVSTGNVAWRPNKEADVLLLGDSFSNIFSLPALGWGESAGFAEHLSHALGGRPIDCILRNSDSAFATREILSRELARGRDRLAGKKLVIWEFAARELAFGDWKMLDLKLGQPPPVRFFVPKPGEDIVVTGTVQAVSLVPRRATVPYADHILALHLADLTSAERDLRDGLESLVYMWSMRNSLLTPAARLRPGDQVTLRLRSWADVAEQYEKINRSEIDDPAVQLEEPCWGEVVP